MAVEPRAFGRFFVLLDIQIAVFALMVHQEFERIVYYLIVFVILVVVARAKKR